MIKVLEDLGIKPAVFLSMQSDATQEVKYVTKDAINASNFLQREGIATLLGVHDLLRYIDDIGLDPLKDTFLQSVVHMASLYVYPPLKPFCCGGVSY
jgi:hypothetical protein